MALVQFKFPRCSLDIDEEKNLIKNIEIASDSLDPISINLAAEILKGAHTHNKPSFPEDNVTIRDIIEMVY